MKAPSSLFMPIKGDNLSDLIANAGIEHLQNYVAKYTPSGHPHTSTKTVDLRVLFRREYFEDNGVASRHPVAIALESEVCGEPVGGKITINCVDYIIVENQPDSKGKTMLILEKR